MEIINNFFEAVDEFIWGIPMIVILLGTHIFMTVRTKFIQRKTFKAIKLSVTKDPDVDGDISPFQALTTALASTIGTGNIVGVGTAIALGGPGAVLWCWLSGVFGIATKYSEALKSPSAFTDVDASWAPQSVVDGVNAAVEAAANIGYTNEKPAGFTGDDAGRMVQDLLAGRYSAEEFASAYEKAWDAGF